MNSLQVAVRALSLTGLIAGTVAVARGGWLSPPLLLGAMVGTSLPMARGWRMARGTALRPAIAWAGLALTLAASGQCVALGEPSTGGRPGCGQLTYLSTLAAFAAAISVLNARNPGGGAWAILMGLLVVVFLIPWLEGGGLVREGGGWDRLRLAPPWTIFYGLLVLAGVTNFLPTRLFPAAIFFGLGFVVMYLGLTRADWPREARGACWQLVATCWGMTAAVADLTTLRRRPGSTDLDRLWLWFRDRWGVVWALRTLERFNRTAEAAGWPVRLAWQGVVPAATGEAEVPPEAAATLAALVRRFATPDRLIEATAADGDRASLPG